MKKKLVVIGGGLSGLAAAIRFSRFSPDEVVLVEKHSRFGGLNSYYNREGRLLETGLHAITNYAPPGDKKAPLNRLFRQLKLKRRNFSIYQQRQSKIHFSSQQELFFTNDFSHFATQIKEQFPAVAPGFTKMVKAIDAIDPFQPGEFVSARDFISSFFNHPLLTDMLLCPLMYYGSARENDIDLNQFIIMFRSIYQEGMFRPTGDIKSFLDMLVAHLHALGGSSRLNCQVKRILHYNNCVSGVEIENGEIIECDYLLSTIGHAETMQLLEKDSDEGSERRLGFVESIFLVNRQNLNLPEDTIIFYNTSSQFSFQRPADKVDFCSGVICLPYNFIDRPQPDHLEIRSTHLANYSAWKEIQQDKNAYKCAKQEVAAGSAQVLEKIIGNFQENVIYQDTFTPLTIERFTAKQEGAIYGSPVKVKDGEIGYNNLFLAGTDQGFLGIIGSMLSGVSIVNQHILKSL